jgi:hypothetical protein
MTISTLLPGDSVDLEAELGVPLTWFAADGTARADLIVTLVAAMAEAMGASFGFAHSRTDLSVGRDEHYTDPYAPIKLLERIVRTRDWGDQAQAIAQWNAFRAPDPDEWMPSDLTLGRK